MASLPILAAVPELILLPLLPLALAFFALVLLNPRPAQHGEQRFSLLIPAEEKDRLAVPLGGLRPGSYASRHTTVRAPSNATSLFRSELGIVGPAVAAGMCFGASALCAVASLAGEEAATGALSRSSGVLNTLGVFFGKPRLYAPCPTG
ncbi:hypothetical protein CALCODRAFT_499917 [Calocera cornea HHB12733]|uniref:Uncharacterized protein n=1 Tax=Calocera cornea HHB12733 TaxID=1353952 RepID=A0A165E9L5_9BASI|nr:hypothetical protein CALCODRAFT_499917 [Calocera cornea HHB12733]